MSRYFLEVSYKGTHYSGFQVQENAPTIQSAIQEAFEVLHRRPVSLTGSSRTDTGVHALQNFFHFDDEVGLHPQLVYKLNAILPQDIVIRNIYRMPEEAHSRFDATGRAYVYRLHRYKNPFLGQTSYYYPYKLDMALMQEGAALVKTQTNFFAFAKTNTQVKNFSCIIYKSRWEEEGEELFYEIEGNRFLRGMVRLLTATILKLGRGDLSFQEFEALFAGDRKCGFSLPPRGLFLQRVVYPENYFPAPGLG
jgi:tRNA pseudouridine38-40 synthase